MEMAAKVVPFQTAISSYLVANRRTVRLNLHWQPKGELGLYRSVFVSDCPETCCGDGGRFAECVDQIIQLLCSGRDRRDFKGDVYSIRESLESGGLNRANPPRPRLFWIRLVCTSPRQRLPRDPSPTNCGSFAL